MNKKHIAGYAGTAIIALAIGAAGSSGGAPQTTAQAAPTVTVTEDAPAGVPAPAVTQTITVPGPTTTVKVPGPATTVTLGPPAPKVAMEGDGTYQIGVDIQPGTYVSSKPDSGNCYWARLNGSEGIGSIIANNNSSGQSVVTIKKSDKVFESSGCNPWTKR